MLLNIIITITTLWCGNIWVMPGTENHILPDPGCYSCCDFDYDMALDIGECTYWPNIPRNQCIGGQG